MKNRPASCRAKSSERRVLDYFLVVREHWRATFLVAAFVVGSFAFWTLNATPVYETRSTIQLSEKGAQQTVLAELTCVETSSSVEAEMEVMSSFPVAMGATQAFSPQEGLTEDTSQPDKIQPTAVGWEKHAYRPVAFLMRRLGRRLGPAQLLIRTRNVILTTEGVEQEADESMPPERRLMSARQRPLLAEGMGGARCRRFSIVSGGPGPGDKRRGLLQGGPVLAKRFEQDGTR